MPPDRRERKAISRRKAESAVFSFVDASAVGVALIRSKHSVNQHVRKLVMLANSPDEKVALQALRELRAMAVDAAKMSGLVQKTTVIQGDDGTISATTSSLHAKLAAPPPLPSATPSAIVVNPPRKKVLNEARKEKSDD